MPLFQKILVTGSTGFVGRVVRRTWPDVVIFPRDVDLSDADEVTNKLQEIYTETPFQAVLHLAAQSSPQVSKKNVLETWRVNTLGTIHLTRALDSIAWEGRFLFVSTGAVYGNLRGTITEQSPVNLSSPYVASKLAAELATLEWGQRSGNWVTVARPFNHSGAGQSSHYFLPSMASQISSLGLEGGVIEVGNLGVHRDFSHVRDIVSAYRALLERGRNQETYNLASGISSTLAKILDSLAKKSGRRVDYKIVPERFREENLEEMIVNTEKIRNHTGWNIQFGLDSMLDELTKEWMTPKCQKKH